MTKPNLPKGFTCTQCGKEHEFDAYVYAHWDTLLGHTCDCGAEHGILRGVATFEPPEDAAPAPSATQNAGAALLMGALRV